MDWNVPQTLLAVLRQQSLAAGARALNVDPATARRRLQTCDQVGSLLALDAAERAASPMAAKLGAIAERIFDLAPTERRRGGLANQVKGLVSVTAGELVALEILLPTFAELVHDYPQLKLKLLAHAAVDDLLRGEADIAVRMFKPEQKALISRRVGAMTLGMWAHRDYLDREGQPDRLEDLARFRIVGPIDETPALRAMRGVGFNLPRDGFSLRCNSLATQTLAVRQAMGIGFTFNAVAAGDRKLVRVLPYIEAAMDVYVVMHEDQRGSLAVRVVYEALVTLLKATLAAPPSANHPARAA
jgi:DNA-binding transcriptional LysR family regulator